MKQDEEDISALLKRRARFETFLEAHKLDKGLCTCPACAYPTLEFTKGNDTCEFCGWVDNGQHNGNADEVWYGPNDDLSLTAARLRQAQEFRATCNLTGRAPTQLFDQAVEDEAKALLSELLTKPQDIQKSSFAGRIDILEVLFQLVTQPIEPTENDD